jgi:formamidopyrimidine-DNA glycosylase
MPELTEVEIVRRQLAKLRGGRIVRVVSADRRVFAPRADPTGHLIREVGRRGKWLRLVLDEGYVFAHLGMTGDWTLRGPDDEPLRFERLRMDVERRGKVTSARYTDPRRFGRFVPAPEAIEAWRELGPDPLLEGIDEEHVLEVMKKRKRSVKEVLMDQSLLAGVGNILAIEGLWNAKIDPRTPSRVMTSRDVRAVAKGLRAIIDRTLAYNERMVQKAGHAKAPFRIYGRAGEPCPRCGTTLRATVLGGRGTTFCPGCQKAHASV